MSNMTFKERCTVAVECLPNAPYRTMLANLLDEMLAALAQPAAVVDCHANGVCVQSGLCAEKPAAQQEPAGEPVAWYTDDHLTDKSATTYSKDMVHRWQCKGWPVTPLYTRPAVPLTRERVAGICTEAGYDTATTQERADFINGIRRGEVEHKIGDAE